jgi:hypothetical protein
MELIITNQEEFDNRPLLPLDIKEKWLEALRSGKYKKGKDCLLNDDKYCCLGVLCEIQERPKNHIHEFKFSFDGNTGSLNTDNSLYETLNSLGYFNGFKIKIEGKEYMTLAYINDESETFDNVIEIIEKYF